MSHCSFIITFHTRRFDNLLQTLRFLTDEEIVGDSELITLCQDEVSDRTIQRADFNTSGAAEARSSFESLTKRFREWRHVDCKHREMSLPILTNLGVSMAGSDKVIVLESDRILPEGYFNRCVEAIEPGVQITTSETIQLARPHTDAQLRSGQFDGEKDERSVENKVGKRNAWSGNISFHKSDFESVGGMDEFYIGYGWADTDMSKSMSNAGVKTRFWEDRELHLWHERATYGAGNQRRLFLQNGIHYHNKWNEQPPKWFVEAMDDYAKIPPRNSE